MFRNKPEGDGRSEPLCSNSYLLSQMHALAKDVSLHRHYLFVVIKRTERRLSATSGRTTPFHTRKPCAIIYEGPLEVIMSRQASFILR